jgi:hypothetical protein
MGDEEVFAVTDVTITDSAGDTLRLSWRWSGPLSSAQLTAKQSGRRASMINLNAEARRTLIRALGGIVDYGSERA